MIHVKAITFDFWNTLFEMDINGLEKRREVRIRHLVDFVNHIGLNKTYEQVCDSYIKMSLKWEKSWLKNMKASTPEERIKDVLRDLGYENWDTEFKELVKNMEKVLLQHYPPVPMEGAIDTIRQLSNYYELAIVSDTGMTPGRVLQVILENYEIKEYFFSYSFSDEVGYFKPDARMFHHALNCLGVLPGEAYHVGDFPYTDIRGAKNVGMGTILFGSNLPPVTDDIRPDFHANSFHEILDFFQGK